MLAWAVGGQPVGEVRDSDGAHLAPVDRQRLEAQIVLGQQHRAGAVEPLRHRQERPGRLQRRFVKRLDAGREPLGVEASAGV